MPILSSEPPTRYPRRPFVSTMMSEMPFTPEARGSVLTARHTSPASAPLVMNVFEPLMTYWSPSRRGGLDVPQVGAGAGLAHGDGRHQLAPGHDGQPAAFLLLAAVGQ